MANNNNNEENNSNHHQEPEWLTKYVKHQGDWLEKTRGNLMVAATVIASMSFQVMVNPPGGVWQEDKCPAQNQTGLESVCIKKAGTSVLEYDDSDLKRYYYIAMVISSTVSFSASMSLILLVILGLRLRNRLIMAILMVFMVVAVICMVVAFSLAVLLVQSSDLTIGIIIVCYVLFWIGFLGLVVLIQVIRLLVWVIRLICCGRSRRSRSRSPRLPHVIPTTQPVLGHSGAYN